MGPKFNFTHALLISPIPVLTGCATVSHTVSTWNPPNYLVIGCVTGFHHSNLRKFLRFICTLAKLRDLIAGWSSPVARQAHNLKVPGSNPDPATNLAAQPSGALFRPELSCR